MRTPETIALPSQLTDALARTAELVGAHAAELLAPMRARLNIILAIVAEEFGWKPDDLKKSTQAILPARRAAVVLATDFLNPPMHLDILADWLAVSETTLYRFKSAVRRERKRDFEFEKRMSKLHGRIRDALAKTEAASV